MVTVAAKEPAIHRLNYGIVFEHESHLHLGQESWPHTFEIQLPTDMNIIKLTGCNNDKDTSTETQSGLPFVLHLRQKCNLFVFSFFLVYNNV